MVNMKGLILLAVALCLSLPLLAADAANIPKSTDPEIEVIDEIVAKVNGAIITRSEISRARNDLIKDMADLKVRLQHFWLQLSTCNSQNQDQMYRKLKSRYYSSIDNRSLAYLL